MKKTKDREPMDKTVKWWLIIFSLVMLLILGLWANKSMLKDRVAAKLDDIRATGYPATCDELEKWYKYPPTGQNAADIVIEAMSHLIKWQPKDIPKDFDVESIQKNLEAQIPAISTPDPNKPKQRKERLLPKDWDKQNARLLPLIGEAELPEPSEPLPPIIKRSIEDYLKENDQTLKLLRQAATIKQSRYPTDWSEGIDALKPNFIEITHSAKLLTLQTIAHIENNHPDLAINSFITSKALAATLNEEPTLIAFAVKNLSQSLNLTTLEYLFSKTSLNENQLAIIDNTIIEMLNESDMTTALVGERCWISNAVEETETRNGFSGIPSIEVILIKATGLLEMDYIRYLDSVRERLDNMKLPWSDRLIAAKNIEADIGPPSKYRIISSFQMPSFTRAIQSHARVDAQLAAAHTAVALERYRLANNSLPDDLAQLVPTYIEKIPIDPFDGRPLRYKKLSPQPGYTIYSIGTDEHDDLGDKSSDATFTVTTPTP
jgi:hypothetical protein